jgi:phosphate transport system permease protein
MKRRAIECVGIAVMFLLAMSGVAILVWILSTVGWKGGSALSVSFLLEESRQFGEAGGIFYQILGTLLLMTGAAVVAGPLALGSVLFQTEFIESVRLKKFCRTLIYSLNAVPTILFGLVGYLVFGMLLETGVSWVTGVLILAVMILPTLHVGLHEAVDAIPSPYREAGQAMGLTPWQQIESIVIPQSLHGLITGILLGLARAAGETAAILFTATAFSGVTLPESWADPVPTLQTHILVLAQEATHPRALAQAWGAALVLILLVFLLIGAALMIRRGLSQEADR